MIDIKMYGTPKEEGNQISTVSQLVVEENNENTIEPHYIWGQLYNGKNDVNGDMTVNGYAYIDNIKTTNIYSEDINSTYANLTYAISKYGQFEKLSGGKLDAEWASIIKAYVNDLACKGITTENLNVTNSAHFFELIIDKISSSGGAVLFTAANGFSIRKVDKLTNGYRLYFLAEDRGTKIDNMWKKNDQAICQNFNVGGDKKYTFTQGSGIRRQLQVTQSSNKYYWALVVNTNNEENGGDPININIGTTENVNIQPCHYIDISDDDYDGIIDPEVDDEIVMLGYRGNDDEARKNAIYISSYASLDKDLIAPLFVQYKGIDDYDLASHKYTWFSGGLTPFGIERGIQANEIRGSLRVTDGKTVDEKLNEVYAYASEVKFSADENYLKIGKFVEYSNDVNEKIDSKASWSYIMQHADQINMQVINGLKQTGIDIKSGKITMNADMTTFLGSISMYESDNGLAIYDDNKIPRVVMNRDVIQQQGSGISADYVPNNIGRISKQTIDMDDFLKLGEYYTMTKSSMKSNYYNKINGYYLGDFTTSDTFTLHLQCTMRFAHQNYDKGIYDVPNLQSSDTGTYKMSWKVYNGNTIVTQGESTTPQRNGIDVIVNCSVNGNYYLDWTIDYTYDANMVAKGYTYYTIGEYFNCYMTKGTKGITFIGTNGLYSSQNLNRYMVYSNGGFKAVEKAGNNISIGDASHVIQNVNYSLGLDPDKGPYWTYGERNMTAESDSLGWAVPIGLPKRIELTDSDFTDQTILDENGNTITVKGYNVNGNIYTQIMVYNLTENFDHYIILPYCQPGECRMYNYSNKNVYIYGRGISNYSKNIYINNIKGTYNSGMWRYTFERNDECLWMIGDKYGWNNLSIIDR